MRCGGKGREGGQHKRQDVCLHGTKRGRRSEVGEVNNTLTCFRLVGLSGGNCCWICLVLRLLSVFSHKAIAHQSEQCFGNPITNKKVDRKYRNKVLMLADGKDER